MRGGRVISSVWLALLAFAGLLGAHSLSFVLVAPHDHQRDELLRSTGHAAPDLFGPVAVAALVAAGVAFVGFQLRAGSGNRGSLGRGRIALVLWLMQTAGFVLLESAERLTSSHPLAELVAEPAFLVGLVAQGLVAVAGALLLAALHRTVEAIRRLLRPVPQLEVAVRHLSPTSLTPRSAHRHYSWSLRGPPLS
ncbi:MAG TPA: hypothetical protein VJ927_11675 [Actinomycetota bacterium]|nr:hypothetical protein [Actinomycetota bacterium]